MLLIAVGILVLAVVVAILRARKSGVPPTIISRPNIFDELRRELEESRKANTDSQKAIDYFIHDLDPDHKKSPTGEKTGGQ